MRKLLFLLLSSSLIGGTYYAMNQDNQSQHEKNKMLNQAVKDGDIRSAQSLIASGADVNSRDDIGFTTLHIACRNHDLEMAQLLLELGANINVRVFRNITPINLAFNSTFRCELLHVWKIITDYSDKIRLTLCMSHHPRNAARSVLIQLPAPIIRRICNFLKPRYLELNQDFKLQCQQQCKKNYALLDETKSGNIDQVRVLLKDGADVNTQDTYGNSLLAYAIHGTTTNWKELLLLLLESGLNCEIKNRDGNTVFEGSSYIPKGSEEFVNAWPQLVTTSKQYRTSLCLAMHPRLGQYSYAHDLPLFVLMEICSYLTPRVLAKDL